MIPEFEVTENISKINELCSSDIDEHFSGNINCKYYTNDEFSKLQNNNFNIFHANVDGLEYHFDDLHYILADTSLLFNVICVSETSQKEETDFEKNISINNFQNPYVTGSKTAKGGVATYVHKKHESFERYDLKTCNLEYETVWTEIKNPKSKNINIGCIYRHPHSNNLDEFIHYMKTTLNKINKENKEVYISGDFNIDLLKYEDNLKYQEFYNMMTSNGFLPQITLPTRITDTTMSIIDNIYSNIFSDEHFSGNAIIKIADHLLQFVSVSTVKIQSKKTIIYKRDFKQFDEHKFIDDISIQNWNNNCPDINNKYNDFIWRLGECVNRHAPIKKMNKREYNLKSKPWITKNIQQKIIHRNRLFVKKKNNPNDDYIKKVYNQFRNSVNRDIKSSKKSYYSNYFENCKNDMKKTWKGIKSLVNIKNKISTNATQINLNGRMIDDPKEIGNAFNNFFSNVGPNTERTVPKSFNNATSYLKNRISNNFEISHTSNDEIF